MTIIYCGQLVTSTVDHADLRDWLTNHGFKRANLAGRKVFLCPKNKLHILRDEAVQVPRYIFNAAAFWAENGRSLYLKPGNSAKADPSWIRVREISSTGSVVIVHPHEKGGMIWVDFDDLSVKQVV